jgi:hypothetical protein
MWESFIYSWAWEGRNKHHTWDRIKERSSDNRWYLESGRRITALSYLKPSSETAKEDAYWAFSAAKLADFIWWASLAGTGAESLYQAHMGGALEPIREDGRLAHRTFANGLIVLNDGDEDKQVECALAPGFQHDVLLDLFDGHKTVNIRDGRVAIAVPAKRARVCVAAKVLQDN